MAEKNSTFPPDKLIRRLTLWAPDPASTENERASLEWKLRGYNYEITVWPRNETEKKKPPIRASLNANNMGILIQNLHFVADSPGKAVADLPIRNMRRVGDTDKREIYEQAVIRVCKSAEGMVFIGVFDADESRSRILFPFTLDRWTGLVKRNGESVSEAEVSSMVAKNTADILKAAMMTNLEITTNDENRELYPKEGKSGIRSAAKNRSDNNMSEYL